MERSHALNFVQNRQSNYEGDVVVESDNSSLKLKPGAGVLVPAGVRHRTNSKETAIFLVFRHKQTACMLA